MERKVRIFGEILSNECMHMLAILLSAKNTCLDIVHEWKLGSTFFPNLFLPLWFNTVGMMMISDYDNNIGRVS